MPYTLPQHNLFAFAAKSPKKAKEEGIKIPQKTALKMMGEGIKKEEKPRSSSIKHLGIKRSYDFKS